MEQEKMNKSYERQYKHSWVAYLRPIIIFMIVFLLSLGFSLDNKASDTTHLIAYVFLGISIAYIVLKVFSIRSVKLYTDKQGVWIYSGILPWTKGIHGVKWRDVEDGIYITNFLSWALKSYTVRVGHRFTKSSEIIVRHVKFGNEAVMCINDVHGDFLSKDAE